MFNAGTEFHGGELVFRRASKPTMMELATMTQWAGWRRWWRWGAVVAVRGVWGDRARGRKRCPKCFYGLDGVKPGADGYTCPECGRKGIAEKSLYRAGEPADDAGRDWDGC